METPLATIVSKVSKLRASFRSCKTKTYDFRRDQLLNFRRMITDNENRFYEALNKDLNRSKFEAIGMDLVGVVGEIDYALENLKKWMKPVPAKVPVVMYPSTAEINYEPFGVCLIVGAFNFPFILTLGPMIGAVAAGNCVIVKPSELASNCEALLVELMPKYLDPTVYDIVTGAIETTQSLLQQKWDKIFFTGSIRVGKIVMKAAAENLTPVALELGGKSPTIVDESVRDMDLVCRRILWGKCANAGQICIAPDYVLCHSSVHDLFVETLKKTILKWYGPNPKVSPDYCRIISKNHTSRISKLISNIRENNYENGNIVHGGEVDIEERYISPTFITNVKLSSSIMSEEIFGPVLPIIKYNNIDDLLNLLKSNPDLENPLTMYLFSKNRKFNDRIINEIPSGGVVVNDTVVHFGNHNIPFGGIGNSGMGGYHGFFSFECFSHRRSIMRRDDHDIFDVSIRYPPYTDFGLKFFRTALLLPNIPSLTFSQFAFRVGLLGLAGAAVGLLVGFKDMYM